MPKITESFLDDLMIVYAAVFLIGAGFGWLYRRRIREFHPDTWRALGSPAFLNNSIANGFKSTEFLLRKRYESLNDPTLNFYGRWARTGFFAILSFIVLVFALMLFGQWQNGVWEKPKIVSHGTYHPLNAVGALMLVIFAAAILVSYLFNRRLKMQHSKVWNELGQPSVLSNTIQSGWRTAKFVLSDRHKRLGDPTLSAYIWIGRALSLAFLGLYIAIVAGFLRT
jgi:hypothetical protein